MSKTGQFSLIFIIYLTVFGGISLCTTEGATNTSDSQNAIPKGAESLWSSSKYISIEEIKPGMKAYCLTEYGTAGIEKFGMEVVDIVHNMNTGRELIGDVILVKGTDERFISTGPVAGCSGSPVYIDGRLAGALAFTWTYSKDPLYAATPIGEMLRIGQGGQTEQSEQSDMQTGFTYNFTGPFEFAEIYRVYENSLVRPSGSLGGAVPLPCPLIISGIPADVYEQLGSKAEPFGLMIAAGGSSSTGDTAENENIRLEPGGCLCVPLVSGDIQISTFGTVTEVIDDKVYGFGHYLLGQGQIDLPMATGKVHTVISNTVQSMKLASLGKTVGALTTDEADGVIGQLGATAKTIDLKIQIDRYNDTQKRVYNCQLATHQQLTPRYLELAVSGAAQYLGNFPSDHMVQYNVVICLKNSEMITFRNVSTELGLNELMAEGMGSVLLLLNNPFKKVDIASIEFDIKITPNNISAAIWALDLSDTRVKAGESIEIAAIIESIPSEKKKYTCKIEIPEELAPGKYELIVCGSQAYEQFLAKSVPHRFIATSMPELIEALNNALNIPRNRLYCLLVLPPSGVTLEKSELPDLPATKAMVLQDTKRTLRVQPYQHWIEKSIKTGTVIDGRKVVQITVEQ
jgi:hypothetical protein